ncbi:ribonuclease H-like domain-containing protein [Tanacetum coccineum]
MITRSQSGIVKPIDRLSLHTFSISPIPKNPSHALKDPNWRNAMYDEYNALVKNGTWLLIPRPAGVNMVRSMWLFKHKFHADGTLSRYKARLVANGCSQQLGVDFDETFSPVVKPATIRTVLSLVVSRQWPIHQLDVKNAFLNGDLSETVYMHQPPGLFLSQKKYALQLLERAHMVTCNPSRTPVDTESKLGPEGAPIQDPTLYRSLAGGLRYLTFTPPDFSYAGTLDLGLHLYASSTTSLVGYTDADWAGCPSTRRSTPVNVLFSAETTWLRNLLREFYTLLYRRNSLSIVINVRVLHVPSRFQYANIFTKGLPSALFEEFRSSLSVRPPPAPTAGAY